jgi:hypothetical protein
MEGLADSLSGKTREGCRDLITACAGTLPDNGQHRHAGKAAGLRIRWVVVTHRVIRLEGATPQFFRLGRTR